MSNNNILSLKSWITKNLVYSRGLVCKKCNENWFRKYNYLEIYNNILQITDFLNSLNPTFPQRVWHVFNDSLEINKCKNTVCFNPTTFFSFSHGYLRTCCPICAQYDPQTIDKIKSTNIERYGVEYGLSNLTIIEKKKVTCLKNYGVDNVSKNKNIQHKKTKTCLKNYGTKWFLARTDIIKQKLLDKYGVDNVLKIEFVQNLVSKTKKTDFFNVVLTSEKFSSIEPLFSVEQYKGCGINHDFLCKLCNTKFVGKIEDGKIPRCMMCFPKIGNSMFQKEILSHVKNCIPTNIDIIENTKSILIDGKELDIYIPALKLAIECDGLYWHSERSGEKPKRYHLNKTMLCERLGIRLIHIFEDEWLNKTSIVKSKLQHILVKNTTNKVFARKCNIQKISNFSKKEFLEKYHIQGNDNSSISHGLFYNNSLVSVMTFNKPRVCINNSTVANNTFELVRFASSTNVIGGASKLLSHFIKTTNPSKIISYADRRWSMGNLYEKLGFKKTSDGTPNYWYFGKGNNYKRHHRFGFAKHTLSKKLPIFDHLLSEWQNMKNNGWDRIWDCGSLKYELITPIVKIKEQSL